MRRPGLATFAVATLLATAALAAMIGSPAPDRPNRRALRDFDTVWREYDRHYPYFGLKGVDWDAQRVRLRPRAAAARDQAALVDVLVDLLAPLDDVHATLTGPDGGVVRPTPPPPPSNWTSEVWLAEMDRHDWRPESAAWGWTRIDDVGYIALSNWDPRQLSLGAVDRVLADLGDADALIVDVRMNGGGADALALGFAGRFTDRPVAAQYVQARDGGRGDFGPPVLRRVEPAGPWSWGRPVVVLVGRGSLSSTETFAAAMAELPQVFLMGDTTGGSSGHPLQRRLSEGWSFTVPRLAAVTLGGLLVEGRGIAPDRVVGRAPEASASGRDPLILAALRELGVLVP